MGCLDVGQVVYEVHHSVGVPILCHLLFLSLHLGGDIDIVVCHADIVCVVIRHYGQTVGVSLELYHRSIRIELCASTGRVHKVLGDITEDKYQGV